MSVFFTLGTCIIQLFTSLNQCFIADKCLWKPFLWLTVLQNLQETVGWLSLTIKNLIWKSLLFVKVSTMYLRSLSFFINILIRRETKLKINSKFFFRFDNLNFRFKKSLKVFCIFLQTSHKKFFVISSLFLLKKSLNDHLSSIFGVNVLTIYLNVKHSVIIMKVTWWDFFFWKSFLNFLLVFLRSLQSVL